MSWKKICYIFFIFMIKFAPLTLDTVSITSRYSLYVYSTNISRLSLVSVCTLYQTCLGMLDAFVGKQPISPYSETRKREPQQKRSIKSTRHSYRSHGQRSLAMEFTYRVVGNSVPGTKTSQYMTMLGALALEVSTCDINDYHGFLAGQSLLSSSLAL
jgi:hypothetical protein